MLFNNVVAAMVIAALTFGAVHLYQGAAGVFATTIVGLVFSVPYFATGEHLDRRRRSRVTGSDWIGRASDDRTPAVRPSSWYFGLGSRFRRECDLHVRAQRGGNTA